MLNLILMNLIAGFTSSLLLRYFFYFDRLIDYLITFFILFLTQIISTELLLGILNLLFLNNVILLNGFILILVYAIIKITKLKRKGDLALKFRVAIENLKFNKIEIFILAIILGFALVKIFINLINPPFGWDSLNYHFTFPVEWLKHGNLNNPIVVSDDPSVSYYPINGSLFFLWLILPLKNVFIADLGQVPFYIIAFLATYSLARKLNLSKEYALFSASLFTLVPNYFKQLRITYVDVIIAALILVSINYLFLIINNRHGSNKLLYSLSMGLLIGTKTTAIPLAFLIFLPFLYYCFKNQNIKKAFLWFAISVILIIITGGFAYLRNFVQTNNPLYPLNFELFNKVIFKGVIDNHIYRTGIRPGDFSLAKILFSEGLGAQTIIFLLPAIFLALPVTVGRRKEHLNFMLLYFMGLPILFILVFRFIIPLPNIRYIYAMFAIGFTIAFYIADVLKLPKQLLRVLVLISALASTGEMARHLELIVSLLLSLSLFFILPHLFNFIKFVRTLKFTFISLLLICVALVFLERDYIKNEYPRYVERIPYSGFWPDATKSWLWLNRNTKGNNIAYVGRPVPFPLYGSHFKNNIYYVSVNNVEPAKLHYFPTSRYIWGYDGNTVFRNFEDEGNYRGKADYSVWLRNLRKQNTDFLFVYSELHTKTPPFPVEDSWANNHPETFEMVFKNDTIHIYKIKK